MIKKVKVTHTASREYFLTELYPNLTPEQLETMKVDDIKEDFSDPDFFDPNTFLESSETEVDLKVEEVQ
jgi:hypothetical protein